jgi:hypothetical protein
MKTYEKHLDELSYEIADDIIKSENNPKWEITFEQLSVTRSLSTIYDKGYKKISEDLDIAVRKHLNKIRAKGN